MWNGDVIRHNFKWNICDVMKRKDLKECYYGVMLTSSGVTKGGHGGARAPPYWSGAPPGAPPYGICGVEKTYSKLLTVPPQKIACPPWCPPQPRMPSYATAVAMIALVIACFFALFFFLQATSSGVTRHRELGGHPGGHAICRGGTGSSSLYAFQYHYFHMGGHLGGT